MGGAGTREGALRSKAAEVKEGASPSIEAVLGAEAVSGSDGEGGGVPVAAPAPAPSAGPNADSGAGGGGPRAGTDATGGLPVGQGVVTGRKRRRRRVRVKPRRRRSFHLDMSVPAFVKPAEPGRTIPQMLEDFLEAIQQGTDASGRLSAALIHGLRASGSAWLNPALKVAEDCEVSARSGEAADRWTEEGMERAQANCVKALSALPGVTASRANGIFEKLRAEIMAGAEAEMDKDEANLRALIKEWLEYYFGEAVYEADSDEDLGSGGASGGRGGGGNGGADGGAGATACA